MELLEIIFIRSFCSIVVLLGFFCKADAYTLSGFPIQFPYQLTNPSLLNSGSSDLIEYPKENALEQEDGLKFQRDVYSRPKQQDILINYSSSIIFDEDNDEPLAPEPVFNTRKLPSRDEKNDSRPITFPSTPSSSHSERVNPGSRTSTRRPAVTSTFKPHPDVKIELPKTVNVTSDLKPTTTTSTTQEKETPKNSECDESREGDCDVLFVDGSVYTAFKVHIQALKRPPQHKRVLH